MWRQAVSRSIWIQRQRLTDPRLDRCLYKSQITRRVTSVEPFRLLVTMAAACVPCYPVNADNIQIMDNPSDFFQTLKDEISSSTRRITMAALYLGSDKMERELVDCLEEKMKSSSDVEFMILLDHARGTRGGVNSCTLLQVLVDDYRSRASVALYHTPHLRGLVKSYLPGKLSESVGLNHIKIFVFDDNVLISGANLSESYFTNRQDRYIMIRKCPDLAEFFHKLIATVATFSMELNAGGVINPHPQCPAHPYTGDQETFITESRSRILKMLQTAAQNNTTDLNSMTESEIKNEMKDFMNDCVIDPTTDNETPQTDQPDTLIYPLVQMGPLGVQFDELALNSVLDRSPVNSRIYLASGYFNLTEEYIGRLITSDSSYSILSASPQVNGFYGARGFSGVVPDVYTQISKQFCDRLEQTKTTDRIKLYEYFRPEWTFHVKGLWYYSPGGALPCMTMIGSPNFGYRSVHRDLEVQVAMVTRNEGLRQRLHQERERIYRRSKEVNSSTFNQSDRKVPLWVRVGTRFLKSFF